MKRIALLGSTGSIGCQTLDIVSQHPDEFEVRVLTANTNAALLIAQAKQYEPDAVVIAQPSLYPQVAKALADLPIKVYSGADALCQVVALPSVDVVVTAMVGFSGLRPTVAAIEANKTIALANKETLVVAGELITRLAVEHHVAILPVDSEHSAIFQSIVGEAANPLHKILLTASGGPFRQKSAAEIDQMTAADALKHPNWKMGAKITIDSATLMNKGFEMIEACWLFGVSPEQVEVVVHPESIIHSAVEFEDGAVKAQLGVPDMRLPIQYALTFPKRIPLQGERLDFFSLGRLTFERPDMDRFPCLRLAYEAIAAGGSAPCILNAANEVVNLAFREGKIAFTDIPRLIEATMHSLPQSSPQTLEDYIRIDAEAKQHCQQLITNKH
ncbi:MAG: 1-deoxy-D-xylulose-5-phosphate reductoisomerase [Bacteroidales bacterium]|nr:1-deoxy-D-xylulose-5-phosphate reductoisomerase [Candidatus Equimonas enterica]